VWLQTDSGNFEFLINLSIIYKTSNLAASTTGVMLMNLKSGGLHEKHAVATWNLETISAFA
jgi:hypothetical protein